MSAVQTIKIVEGFILITVVLFLGELISTFLPVPGNLIGLLLMIIFLSIGLIPLDKVEEFANLLLDNLILIFIPLNVSIMTIWPILKAEGLQIVAINIVSTVLVLVVTGFIISRFGDEGEEGENAESNSK